MGEILQFPNVWQGNDTEEYTRYDAEDRCVPSNVRYGIDTMQGHTLASIRGASKNSDLIVLTSTEGHVWEMFHSQDCCESVWLEDVIGDVDDLIGSPILMAEEAISNGEGEAGGIYQDWTFYKLATVKGYVTLRWCGESNGYYSTDVNVRMFPKEA